MEQLRTLIEEVDLRCQNAGCRHRDPQKPDERATFRYARFVKAVPAREGGKQKPGIPITPDPTVCPDCRREADEAESALEHRIRQEADRARRSAAEVGLLDLVEQAGGNPWEYGTHELETFEAFPGRETALEASRKFASDVLSRPDRFSRVRPLLLWGPTGVAKTEMAHTILKALIAGGLKPGTGVVFDDFGQLVSEVQSAYHGGENVWPLLQRRIRADAWILDDLFSDKVSPDSVRIALQIINGRQGRPTMITMNPDPAMVEDLYPEIGDNLVRLLSRLSRFRAVPVRGDDTRPRVR
jgi:DNA replication protein DnaC